jgi:uncharacterized protein YdaT
MRTMPWTASHYPVSMRHLPPQVRAKAIAIANAMLAEGYEEGQAIRMAIAAAKRWAASAVPPESWPVRAAGAGASERWRSQRGVGR